MPGYSKKWETLAAKAKAYYQDHPELEIQCWLCGRLINVYLPHNDRWSFTLDHVIPKILGGLDIVSNSMPAHRSCNSRRARHIDKGRNGTHSLIKSTRHW